MTVFPDGRTAVPLHTCLTIKAAPSPPTVPPSYTTVPRPPPSPSYRPAAYHPARSEPEVAKY